MSNDHNIVRLPDPPPPAPDARIAALQQALERFDQKNIGKDQGTSDDIRLIERTAVPLRRSRERPVMNRTRYLLAASLACVLAGSGLYFHLVRPQQPQLQQQAALPAEPKVSGNEIVQGPSPLLAKISEIFMPSLFTITASRS